MDFPKQIKDIVYHLLQEPTLDKFRDFLRGQTGEHNSIDFKSQWIDDAALAKEVLALANSQGGVIVFGVSEADNKSIIIDGLPTIKDKAVVSNGLKKYISSNLKYDIYDFSYNASEYGELNGKNFQMLIVEDVPEFIPFLAKKESGTLKQNIIYVRRGTSCEIADEDDISRILDRRINYIHPLKGEPLKLDEHLHQLKILYEAIDQQYVRYEGGYCEGIVASFKTIVNLFTKGERIAEPNPFYPEESYDEFVARMIIDKKKKIERVLDLY